MKLNSKRLFVAMADACLTTNELAEKAGISRASINKFVKGTAFPKAITLGKLSKALGIPVENLIEN